MRGSLAAVFILLYSINNEEFSYRARYFNIYGAWL